MTGSRIDFTKQFTKQFKKLSDKQKRKFYVRLELFRQSPYERAFHNHALKGEYFGYRSINVEGDLRALYYGDASVVVTFAFIGTHAQLYGK